MDELELVPDRKQYAFRLRDSHIISAHAVQAIGRWHHKKMTKLKDVAFSSPLLNLISEPTRILYISWDQALLPDFSGLIPMRTPASF